MEDFTLINFNDFDFYNEDFPTFTSDQKLLLDYSLESLFRITDYPWAGIKCFSGLSEIFTRLKTSDYDLDFVKKQVLSFPEVFENINEIEIAPLKHLERVLRREDILQSYLNYNVPSIFKYHFIFLNRAANLARLNLLKMLLSETYYFKKGAVSWLNRYKMKVDIDITLELDGPNADKVQHQYPPQYTEAFLDVFCETNSLESILCPPMMTEKTWRPLICGKPFLVFGAPGLYERLKAMGFDVFEDVLDLRFDRPGSNDERLTKFYHSLKSFIETYNLNQLDDLNRSLFKRFCHNRKICLDLFENQPKNIIYKLG